MNLWYSNGQKLCAKYSRFVTEEAEFTQGVLQKHPKNWPHRLTFIFRYTDYVLLLNNPTFSEHLDLAK